MTTAQIELEELSVVLITKRLQTDSVPFSKKLHKVQFNGKKSESCLLSRFSG